ncbi:MAG: cysteine desulfurase [Oscillospiraceae bacterium]|nr:cysteine desulfurase [Oscillospiraceae bacterium]
MIYLDHAATTKVCEAAVQAVTERMTVQFGNPSSRHPMGQEAAAGLKKDRAAVARALGCLPEELFFTSGGTEGNNWAIAAALHQNRHVGKHVITTAVEHSAVLEPLKALEQQGYEVTYLQPDETGNIPVSAVEAALRKDTALISMMLVNNETGVVFPVGEVSRMAKRRQSRALLHTDAVQGFLKIPFTPKALGADLLTISGHKVHAPRGIGALYVRRGLRIKPLLLGGGQENGLRSGTEPTPQIAGFAAACAEGKEHLQAHIAHMQQLKQYTAEKLCAALPQMKIVGAGEAPHILCVSLPGYKSEVLVRVLGDLGVCVSAGSACHRGKASHVLAHMKLTPKEREGAFRISFSHESTKEEADGLCTALKQAAESIFPTL